MTMCRPGCWPWPERSQRRKTLTARSLWALLAFFPALAPADVLVLVHGWASNAAVWQTSGVMDALQRAGWRDHGVLPPAVPAPLALPATGAASTEPLRAVYRAQLPAAAPLPVQAQILAGLLHALTSAHPDEALILVGHSAGGVVARLALVGGAGAAVQRLVTIAAPHLGTQRAWQGLEVVDAKPFFCPGPGIDFMKSVFGGRDYDYLKVSRGALLGLGPALPGSLLDWLNRQPHPDLAYDAIVHQTPGQNGDGVVPAFSQDLNQVAALHGRAQLHLRAADHALDSGDGLLLARLLEAP